MAQLAFPGASGYAGLPILFSSTIMKVLFSRVLNILLWLVFCGMTGTGLLLAFRLPPGSRGGHGLSAFGMGRHDWGDWHTWLSYAFCALMLAHLAIHWRWFWQIAGRRRAWPIVAGVGAGVVLILILVFQPVHSSRGGGDEQEGKQRGGRNQQERHE